MHKSVFQTDDDGLFLYETVANDLPCRPAPTTCPLAPIPMRRPRQARGRAGRAMAGRWSKTIAPRRYGWRKRGVYAIGSKIKLRGGVDDLRYPGWGPLPAWLSDTAPQRPAEGAGV